MRDALLTYLYSIYKYLCTLNTHQGKQSVGGAPTGRIHTRRVTWRLVHGVKLSRTTSLSVSIQLQLVEEST
jgi:hypothetical protein